MPSMDFGYFCTLHGFNYRLDGFLSTRLTQYCLSGDRFLWDEGLVSILSPKSDLKSILFFFFAPPLNL